jgi:hypothetical protein
VGKELESHWVQVDLAEDRVQFPELPLALLALLLEKVMAVRLGLPMALGLQQAGAGAILPEIEGQELEVLGTLVLRQAEVEVVHLEVER